MVKDDISYNKYTTEIMLQHNWIVERVCKIMNNSKEEIPFTIMRATIVKVIDELKRIEELICKYTIDETYKLAENLFNDNRKNINLMSNQLCR
jgi:hypothetical protein